MSPPPEHVPRTPDRRSSTQALLAHFRSLTGGRQKSATPPSATSTDIGTPARTPLLSAVRPGSIASPHSADGTLQRISQISGQQAGRPVTGGPPELHDLISQLDRNRPFAERAQAVGKICIILDGYAVENVLALWSVASDLLLPEQPENTAEEGYRLLKGCVSLPKLATIERSVFFDAACLRKNDRAFDRRIDIIITLTKGGRDIEACEPSIVPFLLSSLDTCYKASHDANKMVKTGKKAQGKQNADRHAPESENLARLFQFAIDICKFNAKVFTEDDLGLLLKKAVTICRGTTQQTDLENCIRLFNTTITFVHIPLRLLRPVLEVLCEIYRQVEIMQDQIWNTLSNLFKSHVGQAAISTLLNILLDSSAEMKVDGFERKREASRVFRGTIEVMQRLLFEDGQNDLPKVPLSLLLPTLKTSLARSHRSLEEIVISLVCAIMTNDSMRNQLLAETDLGDVVDIVSTCAEREDDRRRAQNKGLSQHADAVVLGAIDGQMSPHDHNEQVSPLGTMGQSDQLVSGVARSSSPSEQHATRDLDRGIQQLLSMLGDISNQLDFVQREAVMRLLLRLVHRVSAPAGEKVVLHLATERYLHPSNDDWLQLSRGLAEGLLKDATRPRALRLSLIDTLRETCDTVDHLCSADAVKEARSLLLDRVLDEDDVRVLHELVDFAVSVAEQAPISEFHEIIQLLIARVDRSASSAASTGAPLWQPYPLKFKDTEEFGSSCNVVTTGLVRLFTRSVTNAAQKTRILYETLRMIAGSDKYDNDARLTALKLLFRLRADSRHALIVSSSSEGERMAAELCRTVDTAVKTQQTEEAATPDHHRSEEAGSWREQRKTSGSSPHSSLNRHTGRVPTPSGRVSKPIPPLWMYPGPKGLPEEPSSDSSRVVFSHIDQSLYPLPDDIHDMEITLWLELIISLLQRPPDWEIYSYVLVHLGPQLSNQALVRSCVVQLRMLRNVLCEQVRNSSFHEPPAHTLLKKADVAVCLFHVLTVIISYHEYFEKSEEDDLVKAFLQGIVQWDRTSKWCIHALSVCCFEIPLSVSKSLDVVIQKMSQIVTKPATAIHILEFLTSVAGLPELFKNFREDEFKTVFGVCFRYLQHIRDQRERAAHTTLGRDAHKTLRHSGPSRDFTASPDNAIKRGKTVEDDLPDYLYSLAHHVITFWFMALKMEDRPKQIPWIIRNLFHTDRHGTQFMEDHGEVVVDIMNMVAYTDRDETQHDDKFISPGDGEVWKKTWIVGNGLITIETAARTGASIVTTRRPCGTRFLTIRPSITSPPRHQIPITVGLASDAFYSDAYVGILPEDIFQTFYAPLNSSTSTLPLPSDDMTRRAIETFDRIATVDSYRVGVIYIGEGQTRERDIFMNDIGSPAYSAFVKDLGTLCRLKDAKFNVGGLDTRQDSDGEFTYCWRDRCIELIYHIPTMMPRSSDDDMTYYNKKRHIGNDLVNIIFNDSGLPYDFNTFPSAFNYVHIVISPESRASFVDRRVDSDPEGRNRYYKVQTISRHDFPDISPAAEPKILCGQHLAGYCRLIAINACVFSNVFSQREGGGNTSSWRSRLNEIKRLRSRHDPQNGGSPASPPAAMSSPPSRDQNGASPFQRSSIATHFTDGATSRSSISSSSHDV